GLKSKTEQGIFYEQQRDTANAINAYKQALATMAAPMNHLAWLYQAQGKVDEALRLSSLAVQLSNDNADFLDTLAEIQYKRGEYAEALKLMQRAARLNSKYQNKLARFRIAVKK
nr:tetratricopeptide repeat protein [candidate division KSB1 bacterium]NIV69929.1 tetratricopeptide repeat protein [Phycisphaerae bacterium]NIT70119.1 tetratricopeptide repeat protein [candidate division KSB1 bacterium]NIU23776.1 tetratricopeptide repeat protein [candidate division KSB1 bacterium]NIU91961.1 tetratricopeptide repeat protein [candidate division KSB1 bacterium]